MDKIIIEGKELGVYLYMLTGGEPLVRKADILRLAKKAQRCAVCDLHELYPHR